MILSSGCQYGIQACMYLSSWKKPVYISVDKISDYLDIPRYFLAKNLQMLTKHRILESQRGPTGGVCLSRDPEDIYLIEIVKAIDGDGLFKECVLGCDDCHDGDPCSFHDNWVNIREKLIDELNSTTLRELSRNAKSRFPYLPEKINPKDS